MPRTTLPFSTTSLLGLNQLGTDALVLDGMVVQLGERRPRTSESHVLINGLPKVVQRCMPMRDLLSQTLNRHLKAIDRWLEGSPMNLHLVDRDLPPVAERTDEAVGAFVREELIPRLRAEKRNSAPAQRKAGPGVDLEDADEAAIKAFLSAQIWPRWFAFYRSAWYTLAPFSGPPLTGRFHLMWKNQAFIAMSRDRWIAAVRRCDQHLEEAVRCSFLRRDHQRMQYRILYQNSTYAVLRTQRKHHFLCRQIPPYAVEGPDRALYRFAEVHVGIPIVSLDPAQVIHPLAARIMHAYRHMFAYSTGPSAPICMPQSPSYYPRLHRLPLEAALLQHLEAARMTLCAGSRSEQECASARHSAAESAPDLPARGPGVRAAGVPILPQAEGGAVMDPRYERQALIGGWDQQRLTDATITIAGSGPLAFMVGLMATSMGFGRLVMLGGGGFETWSMCQQRPWPELYRRVNPAVRVYSSPARLSLALLRRLPAIDGLIVATNNLEARLVAAKAAKELPIPAIAGGAAGRLGVWGSAILDPVAARLHGHPEFPLLSQAIAALLVEEMRKVLLPLAGEAGTTDQVNYLRLPVQRASSRQWCRPRSTTRRSMVLVGAGALGTWFGMALGMTGLSADLHLYDDDVVSETNLNRQVLFYDAVGKHKAPALAARLQEMFPNLKVYGYGVRADASTEEYLNDHAILVACPDNFGARAYLNGLAQKRGRMLISGGTSATGGSCLVYETGYTACLDCRLRIGQLAERERAPQSCARQAQPSVVTSNALVGALMAWLLHERLNTGRAEAGMWEYDGRVQHSRLRLHPEWPACKCHRNVKK